jgi:hypothetical protein
MAKAEAKKATPKKVRGGDAYCVRRAVQCGRAPLQITAPDQCPPAD